jgi:hypothetical protein
VFASPSTSDSRVGGGAMNETRPDRWLLWALSSFCLLTGASLWETVVFGPVWASGSPATLSVIRANVGIDSTVLWIMLHSLFEAIYLAAQVLNWKLKQRRAGLLAIAVAYVCFACGLPPTSHRRFWPFRNCPLLQIYPSLSSTARCAGRTWTISAQVRWSLSTYGC